MPSDEDIDKLLKDTAVNILMDENIELRDKLIKENEFRNFIYLYVSQRPMLSLLLLLTWKGLYDKIMGKEDKKNIP